MDGEKEKAGKNAWETAPGEKWNMRHWETHGLAHRGHRPASPEGAGCLPPPPDQHPTQVTHLVSGVGCDGDSGGDTRCLSLGRAPGTHRKPSPLALTVSHSLSWIQCWLVKKKKQVKTKALPPIPGERQGARNMQRGFCLCSPVPGGGGSSWGEGRGALTAEDGEGTGQMRLEAWGWGGEEEDRKNSETLMLGRAPAIIRAAPSVGCAHCGRRPFTSLTGWAPRNQPGGTEVTCLATSSVLVT